MLEVIQSIMDLGAVVMLPLVMTILGLVFRMKVGKAVKAGLMIGIGFAGLQLVIGLLMTSVEPAITYYKGLDTAGFTTVDVGWAAMGASVWSVPFAALAILLIVLVNLLMIALKWTNVLNVDIWNYIHFLIPGTLAYALTGSFWVGLIVTVVLSVVSLVVGRIIAPYWQKYYGLEGTTCTTFSFITLAWPVGVLVDKVIGSIPGLKKIDLSMDKVGDRLGFFGDTAIIGLLVGAFLGVLTGQPWQGVLTMGMGIAATLVLLPRMVSVMMEGLSAVGTGAHEFMKRRVGKDRELTIGMDVALALGDPTAITTTVLMIPLAILYAFIIPGMTYFPVGLLTVIVYMVPMISLGCRGNLFRTIVGSALFLLFVQFAANLFAPEATEMMRATGVQVDGVVTDGFFGFNLANVVISTLNRIF
ncbi:PTS galactitol transporter subunit IIC [Propioniciclava coleopterorum]|uniref:PTS galactitol transporter subunit IIC n=1 Tax=Propioniciclava coleopterorum TaxID=2714937 RepID=A0A6G7YAD3_9ACTN|nr:PTS transporter subunit IIC [Propioniciclava coleopterorum]QIK73679.1 PTS galactitol transporter subunit IIC [Propioniciclava coleopterorum]